MGKFQNISVVAAAVVVLAALSSAGPISPQDIVFLGIADNRIFYAEVTVNRTWAQAKARCQESNLNIAAVTSASQVAIIEEGLVRANISDRDYWIAGRETRDFTRFLVWDNESEADAVPVDETVFNQTHNNYGNLITGPFVFCTDFRRPNHLNLDACSKTISGVLCSEIIH